MGFWGKLEAKIAHAIRPGNGDRAIRRSGELLKQFDDRGWPSENKVGDRPNLSQRQAAEQAGISPHQQKQAVRVANVPAEDFERMVERGKVAGPFYLSDKSRPDRIF